MTTHDGGVTAKHRDHTGKICPMSGQPAFTWDEDSTRDAVRNRSGGVCEYCRQHGAQEMHHRKSAGTGGKWSPANIVHLCTRCHRYFTDCPWDGYENGVCLRHGEDAARVPVRIYDGTYLWVSDDVAPPL